MSARKDSVRTVVYLSQENYISLFSATTIPGEAGPRFGMTSKFFNQLLDEWRTRRAIKEIKDGSDTSPHPDA